MVDKFWQALQIERPARKIWLGWWLLLVVGGIVLVYRLALPYVPWQTATVPTWAEIGQHAGAMAWPLVVCVLLTLIPAQWPVKTLFWLWSSTWVLRIVGTVSLTFSDLATANWLVVLLNWGYTLADLTVIWYATRLALRTVAGVQFVQRDSYLTCWGVALGRNLRTFGWPALTAWLVSVVCLAALV